MVKWNNKNQTSKVLQTLISGAIVFIKRLPSCVLLLVIINTLNVTEFRFDHCLLVTYLEKIKNIK